MSITLSTGATVSVAKTYGPSIVLNTITNLADPTGTTAAPHSIAVGEYFEVSSAWGLLDKRVVRAKTGTTGSTLIFENVDTADTSKFPGGSSGGVGSVRRIVAWTALSQVKSVSASGGSQNFANVTGLSDVVEKQVPTTRAAVSMTIDVFDDPTLAWYADVNAADNARTPYGLLMSFPNGSKLAANAYYSLMKIPTMAQNEALMTQITLAYASEPIRYSA